MYPNPQAALPLPSRPDVEQYRKHAKELVKACNAGEDAIRTWAAAWIENLAGHATTERAREHGFVDKMAREVAEFARDRLKRAGGGGRDDADCTLSEAQFVIARAHGFMSWPKLVQHIEGISSAKSGVSAFEQAADAIVAGDLSALEHRLAENPDLIYARSNREHRATLLHYVSANGVEHYRQKTPANVVEVTRRLLDAGAEVDAEADVYGGGWTTLGLVVTSAHPRLAGVQIPLADLLLDRGARVDARIVRDCLANGCPEAAAHMAERGAAITFVDAAGIGRLDVVARHFEAPGSVSYNEGDAALATASWYDQREVVAYLLDHGVDVGARDPSDGDTALHHAAYQGNVALAELLLWRAAPVNTTDTRYGTPPLVWALHAWLVEGRGSADDYKTVIRMLLDAGAEVKSEWIDDDRLRQDTDIYAALSRRAEAHPAKT